MCVHAEVAALHQGLLSAVMTTTLLCSSLSRTVVLMQEALGEFMVALPTSISTSTAEKRGKIELLSYLTELRSHAGV